MPIWMSSALRMLGVLTAGGAAIDIIGAPLQGPVRPGEILGNSPFIPDFVERRLPTTQFVGGGFGHRRRRRRRALTASDRADIAFIAGMISKAAAKDFAVQLAARPR